MGSKKTAATPADKLSYARKRLKELGSLLETTDTLAQDLNEIRRLRLAIDNCKRGQDV